MERQTVTVLGAVVGMSLAIAGMGSHGKPLVAAGTLLTGVGFAVALVRCQRAGVLHANGGFLRRAENPVGFRMASMFWWLVLSLWTFGGVLHGFGMLVR